MKMEVHKIVLLFLSIFSFSTAFANERIALVIGNTNYEVSPLRTAVNDASDIADTLSQLGFSVNLKTNADQANMEMAVQEFGREIQAGAIGLFYYAGHAVQHDGENYLVPIGAVESITAPEHLRYKTVPLGYVLGVVDQSASDLNVVILDSCRNSPFKGFSRNLTRGITRMPSSQGTLVAYSTSPGKVALDGNVNDRNSPYTKNLLKHIKEPGLTIEQVLKKVRTSVKKATNGEQTPWYEASIDGDFYFIEGKSDSSKNKQSRKVIKVATVDPNKSIQSKEIEKKAIHNKAEASTKDLAYIDIAGVAEGRSLNSKQIRKLISGNTLVPSSGGYKGAKIFFSEDGRAHYYKKEDNGNVIEGVSTWVYSGARVCTDLSYIGTNVDLSEKEVCYRFYKDKNNEYRLKIVHIKLFAHWEDQPVRKFFHGKVIQGRMLHY